MIVSFAGVLTRHSEIGVRATERFCNNPATCACPKVFRLRKGIAFRHGMAIPLRNAVRLRRGPAAVSGPSSKRRMPMQMAGAFTEFERALLQERTTAGLEAARLREVHPATVSRLLTPASSHEPPQT